MQDTFHVAGGHAAAHPHLAGADPHHEGAAAAGADHLPGQGLPARHARRDPLADVPPGRGPRGRRAHHDGRPQGHAPALRRARCSGPTSRRALPPVVLPVHRAVRRGRRALLQVRRRRLPLLQGVGLARDPGLGHGPSERAAQRGLRPGRGHRLGLRHGRSSAWPCSSTRSTTSGSSSTTTCASCSSSAACAGRDEDLLPLAEGVRRDRARRARGSPTASPMRGSRSSQIAPVVEGLAGVVVGEIEAIERELGTSAAGPPESPLPRRAARTAASVVCGAPNAAPGLRAAFAPPGATPAGRRRGEGGQDPRRRLGGHPLLREGAGPRARTTAASSCCPPMRRSAPTSRPTWASTTGSSSRDHPEPARRALGGGRGPRGRRAHRRAVPLPARGRGESEPEASALAAVGSMQAPTCARASARA